MEEFHIGGVSLRGHFGLAPMAGVTDRAFRLLCAEGGAGYAVTEMVSAKALTYRDAKSARLCDISGALCPTAVQIFGSDPAIVAEGARLALAHSGAPVLDINMGCPMPKITGNGEGSALLRDPVRAAAVARAAVRAVPVPVTAKIRTGWDETSINAVEVALRLQEAGVAALCIHGRTRAQGYSGRADREVMARVVEALSIPVLVNGDIAAPEDGAALLAETGARYALIGRGSLGAPWLFGQCEACLSGLPVPPAPAPAERLSLLVRQTELAAAEKGEYTAVHEARKHASWYLKGFRGAAAFRRSCNALNTLAGLRAWAQEAAEQLSFAELE